jgi:uncharacterized membrane protein
MQQLSGAVYQPVPGGGEGPLNYDMMQMQQSQQQQDPSDPANTKPNASSPLKEMFYQVIGIGITFKVIYGLNFFTAAVHATSATIIALVYMGNPSPVSLESRESTSPYIPAVCFTPRPANAVAIDPSHRPGFSVRLEEFIELKTYLAFIVVLFFALSAAFQAAQGARKAKYRDRVVNNRVNLLRYVEYSLSASLMMVGIACTLMIYDFFTHVLIFALTFLCMHIGLVADFLRVLQNSLTRIKEATEGVQMDVEIHPSTCIKDLGKLKWFTHWLGWIAIMVPYIAVFAVNYLRSALRSADCMRNLPADTVIPSIPLFVHFVLASQFTLFSIFGFVQYRQFSRKDSDEKIGLATEHSFIILSLVAKSLLGWLLAFNVLFA